MSIENCQLCKKESTPWIHINGHICEDCYIHCKDKKINYDDIITSNDRAFILLGIAISIINEIKNEPEKVKWFNDAVEKVVYENKPIPEMPK